MIKAMNMAAMWLTQPMKVNVPHLDLIIVDRRQEEEGEDHALRLHLDLHRGDHHHLSIVVIILIIAPHLHHRGVTVVGGDYPTLPGEDTPLALITVFGQALVVITMAAIELYHPHPLITSLVTPLL